MTNYELARTGEMNRPRRRPIPATLAWLACLLTTPLLAQQTAQYRFIEEIREVPEAGDGSWVVGGVRLQTNPQTVFDFEDRPAPGTLAEVVLQRTDNGLTASLIRPLPVEASAVHDGPYVIWKDGQTAEVIELVNGIPDSRTIENITEPRLVASTSGPDWQIHLDPQPPQPEAAVWPMPQRLMAISDLEGNLDQTLEFLRNNGVVDADGHWAWGEGHLVLIGDLVDRGDQVTGLMWLVYRLAREAGQAGGQVHYVLGNHEAMVMGGDLRYIHWKYRFVTGRLGRSYDQLFNENSVIGRWWRTRNGLVIIGNLMFVHAGYSPRLDEAGLDVDTLNQRIRAGLAPARPEGLTADTNPVRNIHGPFWYRGYFDKHAAEWGGKATDDEVGRILQRHHVDHVVIGHTLVDEVGPLDETGQVIAIDVDWKDPQAGQGLLVEDGRMWRVDMQGRREALFPAGDDRP